MPTGAGSTTRSAGYRFRREPSGAGAICCAFPDGSEITVTGVCEGRVARAPRGEDGFGYDPIFLVGKKTYAELSPSEKDAVSHRGKALRLLAERLREHGYE